jgi:nicotinate-nucleotide--dimethylbenzimidazole phosphoribosyltransferase
MTLLQQTCDRITGVHAETAAETQRLLDLKTKPRRSLGRLEELACRISAIRGIAVPSLPRKAIVVMAADHGVAEEGVSAYPSEVTGQMLLNFARGGAAINVLARRAGAEVVVADMGVKTAVQANEGIRSLRLGPGTGNFTRGPAMSRQTARSAVEVGIGLAEELTGGDITLLGIGDMGIANTTASSALAAAYTGSSPDDVTGRGTGIDEDTYARKLAVVRRGLALHPPDPRDPLDTLARLGGFEIAGLAGVVLGCAAAKVPVVLDGFITGVAALAAVRLAPQAAGYLIASHRSVEKGHRVVLEALEAKPLLDLDLRLGEGTGAALAMGLVDAALLILHEMATFHGAGVTDSGA